MDVPPDPSRPVGSIFVEKGLITREQLETALRLQQETGERLGEIVVGEFGVPRLELASVLAEQWADLERVGAVAGFGGVSAATGPPIASPPAPGEPLLRRPIGEIFVERGFVDEEQLRTAVELQRKTGQRLGEVLVEQGALSRLDLASALAEQWANIQRTITSPTASGTDAAPQVEARAETGQTTDVARRLARLESELTSATTRDELEALAGDMRAELAGLERRLATAIAGDEESTNRAQALGATVEERLKRFEDLEQRLADRAQLTQLGERLEAELAALSSRVDAADSADALADVRARVDELSAQQVPAADALEALRARVDQLAADAERSEPAVDLELTDRVDAVAGQAEAVQTGLAAVASRLERLDELSARIDAIAAQLPGLDVVEELRRSLTELADQAAAGADRPDHVAALGARLDQVSASLDDLGGELEQAASAPARLEVELDALRTRLAEVAEGAAAVDLEPVELRLAALDERAASVESLEQRLDQLSVGLDEVARAVASSDDVLRAFDRLGARLADVEGRIATGQLGGSNDELRDVREQLAELSARDEEPRFTELERALDALRSELTARLDASRATADAVSDAGSLGERIAEVERRLASTVGVDAVRAELARAAEVSAAERASLEESLLTHIQEITAASTVAGELEELRRQVEELAARGTVDVEARSSTDELRTRVEEIASREVSDVEARSSLDEVRRRADEAIAATAALDEVARRIDELEAAAATDDSHSRLLAVEHRLDGLSSAPPADDTGERLDGIEARLSESIGREEMQQARDEHVGLYESLRASVADVRDAVARSTDDARRHTDARIEAVEQRIEAETLRFAEQGHGHDAALTEIRERLSELVLAAADQDEWHGRVEAALDARVDGIGQRLEATAEAARSEAVAARGELGAALESLAARIGELDRQRDEDREGSTIAGDELAARVDDLARRLGEDAAALHAEHRGELEHLASRLAQIEGATEAARDAARAETERLTSSLAWRLEQVEGSLSANDASASREALERLEHRLDEQAARAEEQVRVTEKALRKGLAALGAQLAETEASYAESGDALRRSIERLGAAVSDADERIAEGPSVEVEPSGASEFVAFAPTEEGYRLVVVDGVVPEVGDAIELPEYPGPLVVTRLGRSPLPLDARPCAYLDRLQG